MPAPPYDNLDVRFGALRGGSYDVTLTSPAGPASGSFTPPALTAAVDEGGRGVIGRPRAGASAPLDDEGVGRALFDALFKDKVGNRLQVSRDRCEQAGHNLRIRLWLHEAPELSALPWELLYDAERDRFFALSTATPVVRFLDLPEPPRALEVEPPLRMLIVCARPTDQATLDVEKELKRIEDALAGLVEAGRILVERAPSARLSLQGHTDDVRAVAFSPDGTRVVTASFDNTARLWDAKDGKPLTTLQGHTDDVRAVAFSPDGTRVVTASDDTTARLWDTKDGKPLASLQGHTDRVWAVAFSPDGTRVATASRDKTTRLWDAKDGKPLATLQGHTEIVWAVAFSPDGTRVVTASDDNAARLWDAKDGNPLATLQGHTSWVRAVAFSPDGTRVATGSDDTTARLWDAKDGQPLATLQGHTSWVRAVAFSPDGTRVATGSEDKTARLWDVKTGDLLATLPGHLGGVQSVAFSPDGRHLATASTDGTARIWSATPEGLLIQACQYLRPWSAYDAQVAATCAPYVDRTP